MKISFKNESGRWKNITKVNTVALCEEVIIIKMLDGSIKTLNRGEIKHLRITKLYEGVGLYRK